ncbi:MAG: hybrid sensor histidine kinase/response regulator [Aphanocapsa sp. GSE-SYN-MK-11-07L]|jgi:signal transduction histidine kinase|nr:hybrid sensor histidine kinase/response regulator [Aphanocapsa sp. GSE-SYN-MK-11-07L]
MLPAPDSTRAPRILAVDDLVDNLALIEAVLEDEGYSITLALDGATALAQVEHAPPDLILLDIMMPDMDGYEVTRRIRQNKDLPFIPILLLTAYDKADVVLGLDAGADDFVRKPVDADELTARVRSLLRLKFSFDEREQLAMQREDFIAHLTHDLRTPLVAADMMYKLFQKEAFCPLSADMQGAVTALARSNQNLLEMVNTLLEVNCYEAGSKTLTLITCDMWKISQSVIQEIQPLAKAKEISLSLSINPDLPDLSQLKVLGDCQEVRRMVTNVVANSIKFTDTGSVKLRLGFEPSAPNDATPDGWVIVAVQDTGFGISAEEQSTIFQRFRKGSHKQAGSGLGLHLVQRIVTVHHGTISVSSQPGQGSLFTIRLPAYIEPAPSATE